MLPTRTAKPTASITIEPMGRRSTVPRSHSVRIILNLSPIDPRFADKGAVADVARAAMAELAAPAGQVDRRTFGDVTVPGKHGTNGTVVGVEGSTVWAGRPTDAMVERLRTALVAAGYRVAIMERRECIEPSCSGEATVEWSQTARAPQGWYSSQTCRKHNYRACAKCRSLYVFSSANAVGQAPSVPCEVCGETMVEWGSSKVWSAQLVTRVELAQ